jgi:hypothetical protein
LLHLVHQRGRTGQTGNTGHGIPLFKECVVNCRKSEWCLLTSIAR